MINVTELKRKVIDEFLTSQPLVTNTSFKSVAKIYTGESTNAEEKNKYSFKTDDCYPYVSTKDISMKGNVNFENGMYIPKGEKKFSIAPVNSILLCIEGGNAGNKIAIVKEATCFVNKLCCFDIFGADNRFIYYYLLSNQFRNNFKEQMTGLIGGVSVKKLKELILPLPHITEQKRIADKLDVIFAELDKIDEKQTRLAIIQEKMEAKILKLAIQGKLVEQRPGEGTGEELFKHIQLEKQELIKQGKIKKEKPLPSIEEYEIPFEIPSSWKWCKFGQLISLTSGVDLEPKDYFSESNCSAIPYITGASCIDEKGNLVINRFTDKSHVNSTIGDILLTCKGTIGKITVNDKGNMHLARQLMGIKTLIDFDFTRYYLMFIVDELKTKANGLIPGIDRPTVLNYYLPLPPLEEQKRIVVKIKELLPLCRGN